MGYFTPKKKEEPIPTEAEMEDLKYSIYLNGLYQSVQGETTSRLDRYRLYNRFRQGEQWFRIRQGKANGAEQLTHNFCDPIVRKYASLLMGDVPKLVVPREAEIKPMFDIESLGEKPEAAPVEEQTPVQFDRSEAIEKILRECLFVKNNFRKALKEAALNGSELGDSMFFVYWNKEKKQPCIERIFPGYVRLGFSSTDSDDLDFAFVDKVMSLEAIQRRWNFSAAADTPTADIWDVEQFRTRKVAVVRFCWDREYYSVQINNTLVPNSKVKHNYSRIPLFHIPNIINGFTPWGESDIKQIISIQESYNLAVSDEANLSKMYADPKVIVYNPGKTDLASLGKKGAKIIPASKDSRIEPLAFTGQLFPMQNRINRIKQDIHDVSAMPAAAFGNAQGSIVTGVAMTAQFQPTLQAIADKITLWDDGLRKMMAFILELYEQFGGTYPGTKKTYKEIINGQHYTEWQWSSKVPRDDSIFIQNETLKMNQRLQSRSRTMSNLGIDSPQDELFQIALEENNPTLNPKLAIEKAAVDSQTGEGQEAQMMSVAEAENDKMAAGNVLPAVAKNKKEHMIHIEVHGNYLKHAQDLPPDIIDIFDQHIQGHEQALATGGSGSGGFRVGAGREAEGGMTGPTAAGADQAMAVMAAAAQQANPTPQTEGY